MLDRDDWTPQNIVIGLGVLFVSVWSITGEFIVGILAVTLVVLRMRTVRNGLMKLLKSRPKQHRYSETGYDPFATALDEDADLPSMPRYSEGRTAPPATTAEARPVRQYENDDDDDNDEIASSPLATPSVRFSASPPPKKPVQLPRHRP